MRTGPPCCTFTLMNETPPSSPGPRTRCRHSRESAVYNPERVLPRTPTLAPQSQTSSLQYCEL